jgi:hypothetical protein
MGPRSWAYGCGCSLFLYYEIKVDSFFVCEVFHRGGTAAAAEQMMMEGEEARPAHPMHVALGRPAARSRATVLARGRRQ